MENSTVIHQFANEKNARRQKIPVLIVVILLTAVAGIITGYLLKQQLSSAKTTTSTSSANAKTASGIADKKTFKDKAEGILKVGGIDGEGNFHLERPGGTSQNVYLTSSTVDLQQYVNKKVRVWGATFQAQQAGWLMDVGYVEIL